MNASGLTLLFFSYLDVCNIYIYILFIYIYIYLYIYTQLTDKNKPPIILWNQSAVIQIGLLLYKLMCYTTKPPELTLNMLQDSTSLNLDMSSQNYNED